MTITGKSGIFELIVMLGNGSRAQGNKLTLAVSRVSGMHLLGASFNTTVALAVFNLVFQQIAFKNLVQRNRQTEQQANRPPPPNSIIHLPFIIVNTSKKTVIDCSISNDK